MPAEFEYDVFLSYSSKDVHVVRPVAERLRVDGVRVWFDQWMLKAGMNIPREIEQGLARSKRLVLCISENVSDWTQLESGTFRFDDPLNKQGRFIPLKLDDAPVSKTLAQFLFIDWREEKREEEYPKLLEACRARVLPVVDTPSDAVSGAGTPPLSAPLSQRLVTYALGLFLGLVIGWFVLPLLELVPQPHQRELVTPSSTLMAIIAVVFQFYGYRRWSNHELAPYFTRTLVAAVAAMVLFLIVHTFTTVTIETTPGNSMSFVTGFTRPHREPCPAEVSDALCIERLSSNLSNISSFWGDGRIKAAVLALKLSYLAATSALGALVGLIVLSRRR
jgi:hypothetical protein